MGYLLDGVAPRAREGVSGDELRAAMGHFATGVAVITAADADGRLLGTTANAISSLSLEPPLVLACLRHESETLGALQRTGRFGVSVLGADQLRLSDRFARRSDDGTWDGVAYRVFDGVPLLEGSLATVECRVHDIADGGDHAIAIGQVVAVAHPEDGAEAEPLLVYRGGYAALDDRAPEVADAPVREALDAVPEISLPSALGALRMLGLPSHRGSTTSVAVLVGEPHRSEGAAVHLHRGCLLGDALGSQVCRSRERLHAVLANLQRTGRPGVVVYHRDDAAGFGTCCLSQHADSPLTAGERDALRQAIAQLALVDPEVVA
jgi:3-hydroxy-9,10-secoandrosta-1,3,5(10)-triene-9,17-dione monooxygenase reductase component